MSLTRHELENHRLRHLWAESGVALPALSDAELDASLRRTLASAGAGDAVWLFRYGSLMWNPLFHYAERRPATQRGFGRTTRGTRERPGLVLGFDLGGSCQGLACRLPAEHAARELKPLWNREMVSGASAARWVRIETAACAASHGCAAELRALTFTVNREHPNYAGRLPSETLAAALAEASRHLGSSADYLFRTVDALAAHGLRDAHLEALRRRVEHAARAP
jgi:cation transport protein ChaC